MSVNGNDHYYQKNSSFGSISLEGYKDSYAGKNGKNDQDKTKEKVNDKDRKRKKALGFSNHSNSCTNMINSNTNSNVSSN